MFDRIPGPMGKVWVLDTGTKGTGASMVPLESTLVGDDAPPAAPSVPRKRAPRKPKPAAPLPPRRFKVVDVMSGEALAEDADARGTLDVLRDLRSVVDARIYLRRSEDEPWRLLTLAEQRSLWRLRDRPDT